MKNSTYYLIFAFICIFTISHLTSGCNSLNDIQEEYASQEEIVYLTKVDSITTYPGVGEVKLVYWICADPKIEQTVVYWNVRQDSVVKDFIRTRPGKQKDSVVITGLKSGTYQFQLRNKNHRGEFSLYSTAVGRVLAEGESLNDLH